MTNDIEAHVLDETKGQASFRDLLDREFQLRQSRNRSYSKRAFARDLGISSGRLSEVMLGRDGLTLKTALKISEKLGFSNFETDTFCDLVLKECARSESSRKKAEMRLKYSQEKDSLLDLASFAIISDWHHFAILELTLADNAPQSVEKIAERLSLSLEKTELAIKRLIQLKLLKRKRNGFEAVENNTLTGTGIPSRAVRQFHYQILEKAKASIEAQNVEKRDLTAEMLLIDKDKLPEAKKALAEFRKSFCRKMGQVCTEKNELYMLSTQLFSLEAQ